jgi:hypothetical protein
MLAATKCWRWQKYTHWQNYWPIKLLASKKYRRRQNIGVDKILVWTKSWCRQNLGADKIFASTKSLRLQKAGTDKKMAQTQKNPLTVWLGRITSCWLLPGTPEDLLRLPDGVALFACSRQVRHRLQTPCFYGRTLSRTVLAYCTSPPCWKCQKFWRRQNIGVRLKFTEEGVWASLFWFHFPLHSFSSGLSFAYLPFSWKTSFDKKTGSSWSEQSHCIVQ